MQRLRDYSIQYLKGIGPRKAEVLKKHLGIESAYDLLRHFPTHYLDRSKIRPIASLRAEESSYIMLKGRFITFTEAGEGARRRLTALFTDGTGAIEVVWFRGIKNIRSKLSLNKEYCLFGKPSRWQTTWQLSHPEIDTPEEVEKSSAIRGVYPLADAVRNAGISSRSLSEWICSLLASKPHISETLPPSVLTSRKLMPLREALIEVHSPSGNPDRLANARFRLKFEEVFHIQVTMLQRGLYHKSVTPGQRFTRVGEAFNDFYHNHLPFALTNAQKRVVKEIHADVNTGRQMNRLVQGDVGSGKTAVALLSMLLAVDNGCQACMMAPTEILAGQHFEGLSALLKGMNVTIGLLTGSTTPKKRESIHQALRDGSLDILVGTHALIEENVMFRNLGLAVIDEQHRFGVAQRAALWHKNQIPPHVLVMTATPIPRTLAMTVYGDLDVSVIDELPPGRKPIETLLRYDSQRLNVWKALYAQLRKGAQAYIVYPLIDENEKLDLKSLKEGYEQVRETFRDFNVAFVHGRMKQAEKDFQMEQFVSGKAQILVATTVIEVGVNVPAASVMVIENAERFGLSQLHQLRGRVGRGMEQSYCILMSKPQISKDTRKRLELMTETTDGFVIAEADMQMRGPGDIEGTLQSGVAFDLKIANLATDGSIIQLARNAAEQLLADDPNLLKPENIPYAKYLRLINPHSADWSKIS